MMAATSGSVSSIRCTAASQSKITIEGKHSPSKRQTVDFPDAIPPVSAITCMGGESADRRVESSKEDGRRIDPPPA